MTMLIAQSDGILLNAECERPQSINPNASLSFSISLNADRRRIFQVLTISEYMETWITVPGRQHDSQIKVVSDPSGFHVHYLDEKLGPSALVGSYQTYRTSKTNILWRRTCDREPVTSFIKIRLNGDFERTTLSLRQSGLASIEECEWHSQLWALSLEKLRSLFELQ